MYLYVLNGSFKTKSVGRGGGGGGGNFNRYGNNGGYNNDFGGSGGGGGGGNRDGYFGRGICLSGCKFLNDELKFL